MASSQSRASSWQQRVEDLKAYKLENGDCLVPQRYKPNPKLGRWVENCRSQYRRFVKARREGEQSNNVPSGMTVERILELEEIGMVWTVGRGNGRRKRDGAIQQQQQPQPALSWHEQLAEIKASRREEEEGEDSSDDEKMRAVAQGWNVEAVDEETSFDDDDDDQVVSAGDEWNQRLLELKQYQVEHGNCLVPTVYASNPQLGRWVSKQRALYRRYSKAMEAGSPVVAFTIMDGARVAALEELGFVWVVRGAGNDRQANFRWQQRLEELKAYKAEHGDCLVPNKYEPNMKLARWVMNNRSHYRIYMAAKQKGETDPAAGGMNEDRIAQLEEIGFVFLTRPHGDDTWNHRLQELKAYKEEHGDCLVPRDYAPNPPLSNWVANQRLHYRYFMDAKESKGSKSAYTFMTEDRIAQLDALGFTWALTTRRKGKTQPEKNPSNKKQSVKNPAKKKPEKNISAKKRKRVASKPDKTSLAPQEKARKKKRSVSKPAAPPSTRDFASKPDDEPSILTDMVKDVMAV